MLADEICSSDTIVALATPPGRSAIGIVRFVVTFVINFMADRFLHREDR